MKRHVKILAEVDIEDVLDAIDNETLNKYLEERGWTMIDTTIPVENYKPEGFRRILCDVLSLGYQVSDDEILGRIKGCL